MLDPILAKEGLEKLMYILNKAKIAVWLDCGTLLGAIREKNFIEYDFDIDLGIKIDDVEKIISLREELKEQDILMESQRYNNVKSACVCIYASKIKIELYVWHKIDTKYRHAMWHDNKGWVFAEVDSIFYDDLDKISFLGKEYFIPKYIDKYLSLLYHDWRIPLRGAMAFNFTSKKEKEFLK